eukprot:COSAG02_NODE_4214_length_5622_cov_4.824009_1_plen_168_part_10
MSIARLAIEKGIILNVIGFTSGLCTARLFRWRQSTASVFPCAISVATPTLAQPSPPQSPPPPPLPPGQVVLGPWLHRNGTIGEYHRLFMPEVAARWTAWQRCRVPAAGGGALLGAESSSHRHNTSNGPTGKPMVWLSARFDAPAPVSSNRSSSGPPLPLAVKMGSTSV